MTRSTRLWLLIALILVLTLVETMGMSILTSHAVEEKSLWKLFAVVILYGVMVPGILLLALSHSGIGVINLMWNICTTMAMLLIGFTVFHERLNRYHLLSFVLAILAGIALYRAEHK